MNPRFVIQILTLTVFSHPSTSQFACRLCSYVQRIDAGSFRRRSHPKPYAATQTSTSSTASCGDQDAGARVSRPYSTLHEPPSPSTHLDHSRSLIWRLCSNQRRVREAYNHNSHFIMVCWAGCVVWPVSRKQYYQLSSAGVFLRHEPIIQFGDVDTVYSRFDESGFNNTSEYR